MGDVQLKDTRVSHREIALAYAAFDSSISAARSAAGTGLKFSIHLTTGAFARSSRQNEEGHRRPQRPRRDSLKSSRDERRFPSLPLIGSDADTFSFCDATSSCGRDDVCRALRVVRIMR
jgi:hypothetical protein